MNNILRHYEESRLIQASPQDVFEYADNPASFSSHMNKSSWMMFGGKMQTLIDEGKGQKVGSHIKMNGKVLGISLFLDEVITKHKIPFIKEWQTVGNTNLLIIGHYKLGFEIKPEKSYAGMKVYIDYELPQGIITGILGYYFGEFYAKWCVKQMINGTTEHFIIRKK